MAALNFDSSNVDPDTGFDPIPAGEYVAFIEESEIKPTKIKAGESEPSGFYLQLVWQVCDGPMKGRKLWHRINIQNRSQQAEDIGQKELSAVCHATGVIRVGDSAELHDKPCLLSVVLKPADGQYGASNEVKGVKSLNGNGTPAPGPAAPTQQAAPVSSGYTPPPAAAAPQQQAAPATTAPPWQK